MKPPHITSHKNVIKSRTEKKPRVAADNTKTRAKKSEKEETLLKGTETARCGQGEQIKKGRKGLIAGGGGGRNENQGSAVLTRERGGGMVPSAETAAGFVGRSKEETKQTEMKN